MPLRINGFGPADHKAEGEGKITVLGLRWGASHLERRAHSLALELAEIEYSTRGAKLGAKFNRDNVKDVLQRLEAFDEDFSNSKENSAKEEIKSKYLPILDNIGLHLEELVEAAEIESIYAGHCPRL